MESVFGLVLYSLIHLKGMDWIKSLPLFTHSHVVAVANLYDLFSSTEHKRMNSVFFSMQSEWMKLSKVSKKHYKSIQKVVYVTCAPYSEVIGYNCMRNKQSLCSYSLIIVLSSELLTAVELKNQIILIHEQKQSYWFSKMEKDLSQKVIHSHITQYHFPNKSINEIC